MWSSSFGISRAFKDIHVNRFWPYRFKVFYCRIIFLKLKMWSKNGLDYDLNPSSVKRVIKSIYVLKIFVSKASCVPYYYPVITILTQLFTSIKCRMCFFYKIGALAMFVVQHSITAADMFWSELIYSICDWNVVYLKKVLTIQQKMINSHDLLLVHAYCYTVGSSRRSPLPK